MALETGYCWQDLDHQHLQAMLPSTRDGEDLAGADGSSSLSGVELAHPSGQGQRVPKGKQPRDLMPHGEGKAAERWVPAGGFPGVSREYRQDSGWQRGQEWGRLQSN